MASRRATAISSRLTAANFLNIRCLWLRLACCLPQKKRKATQLRHSSPFLRAAEPSIFDQETSSGVVTNRADVVLRLPPCTTSIIVRSLDFGRPDG